MYNSSHYWSTGGLDGVGFKSTELYNVNNNKWSKFVDLPDYRWKHILVRINETHIMLVGNWKSTNQTWMFNQMSEEWTECPNTLESRGSPYAGLVKFANGSQVVIVAGGGQSKTAEAFNVLEEKWTFIRDLPVEKELHSGSSVPFGGNFLIVGGWDYGKGNTQNKIIQFDQFSEDWTKREEEMEFPRQHFTSFLVPNDYVACV